MKVPYKVGEDSVLELSNCTQQFAISSYLGELDAFIWACKCTKAFRANFQILVHVDDQALIEKWKRKNLCDRNPYAIKRWGWFLKMNLASNSH